jgi:hypothetical protein
MMKFAWRNNIGDLAAWNSSQVNKIEDGIIIPYKDLLVADQNLNKWNKLADEFHFE